MKKFVIVLAIVFVTILSSVSTKAHIYDGFVNNNQTISIGDGNEVSFPVNSANDYVYMDLHFTQLTGNSVNLYLERRPWGSTGAYTTLINIYLNDDTVDSGAFYIIAPNNDGRNGKVTQFTLTISDHVIDSNYEYRVRVKNPDQWNGKTAYVGFYYKLIGN